MLLHPHKYTKLITFVLILLSTNLAFSQQSSFDFGGYISDMPYLMHQDLGDTSVSSFQNIRHNRLNFSWYATTQLSVNVSMRNQLIWGDNMNTSNSPKGIQTENYFLPLSYFGSISDKTLWYSVLDRANVSYMKGDFEAVIGRQRINWGQTFAWNPNDIFNSYNFFDFDYEEKPGADAIKLQYYTGYTSSLQLAAKIDSGNSITAAALYRFNKWNYDIQFLTGYFSYDAQNSVFKAEKHADILFGAGWSGDLFGLSFRGEMSYFQPAENIADTSGIIVSSFALDYTFSNELYLSTEFLYQQIKQLNLVDFNSFYTGTRNAKSLSDFKYNAVAQVSYPITPILNVSFAGMYFWQNDFKGFYTFPMLSFSASNAIELSLMYQLFMFKEKRITNNEWLNAQLGFFRFKWSF